MFRALYVHHEEVKIALYSIWYRHTPVGSRPVHRLREDSAGFVISDGCITLMQFYLGVLVLMYLLCLFCIITPVGGRPVHRLREEIMYYEVSHFVILSSLLSPLSPNILLSTLWPTPHFNFVVFWNMIHSKGVGISQTDLSICCILAAQAGTVPDKLQETTMPLLHQGVSKRSFPAKQGIFFAYFLSNVYNEYFPSNMAL